MLRNLVLTPLTCFGNALLQCSGFASMLLFLANPKEKSAFFSHSLFKEVFKGFVTLWWKAMCRVFVSAGFSGLLCHLWGPRKRKLGGFLTFFFFFFFETLGMTFEVRAALIQ